MQQHEQVNARKSTVLVIGAGFAGVPLATALAAKSDLVDVTLVDRCAR